MMMFSRCARARKGISILTHRAASEGSSEGSLSHFTFVRGDGEAPDATATTAAVGAPDPLSTLALAVGGAIRIITVKLAVAVEPGNRRSNDRKRSQSSQRA